MPTKDELQRENDELRAQLAAAGQAQAAAAVAEEQPPAWLQLLLTQQQAQMQAVLGQQQSQMHDLIKTLVPSSTPATSPKTNVPRPSPPPTLERGVTHALFKVWRESWNDFVRLSELHKEDPAKQVSMLKALK
jgi:hypothetical protein